jgi:aminoglycoside phosphotransferase
MPGLSTALDPEAMRARFAARFGPGPVVDGCVIERIRHRSRERAIVQYALAVRDVETGLRGERLCSALLYAEAGRAPRVARKLGAAGWHEADLDMAIQLFPHDRKLPALAAALSAPPAELRSALGIDPHAECRVRMLRYRAGLSGTLRYGFGERQVFAKIYADDQGAATAAMLDRLAGVLPAGLGTVRALAYLPEARMLAIDAARGECFEHTLTGPDAQAHVRQIAAALVALHRTPVTARTLRRHTRVDEIANMQRARDHVAWCCPHLNARVTALTDAIAAQLPELPSRLTHRDLKIDHLFLDGDTVNLIDMDSCALSDPMLDVALFAARLFALPLRGLLDQNAAQTLVGTFLATYLPQAPAERAAHLPLLLSAGLLDVAQGFFVRQEANWRAAVESMVTMAEDAFASLSMSGSV